MNYTILLTGMILRSDGACIPPVANNSDYQAYLLWVAAGNTAATQQPPILTKQEAIQAGYAYLATQGWGDTNLAAAAGGFPFMSSGTQAQYAANYAMIQSMYGAASSGYSGFNASGYTLPYSPIYFGLDPTITY